MRFRSHQLELILLVIMADSPYIYLTIVDGGWCKWSSWGSCSKSCNGGTQVRSRTCTNPEPQYGGKQCAGSSQSTRACNQQKCPQHGNWAGWSRWSSCSKTCGGGTRFRNRTCSNPPPAYGGEPCHGSSAQTQYCTKGHCPG